VLTKIGLEYLGEVLTCFRVRLPVKAGVSPGSFAALDDEGAGRVVELVSVRDEQPGFVLAEDQRQPLEQLTGAEPDVPVLSQIERRLKLPAESSPNEAVGSIRSDQQIVGREFVQVGRCIACARCSETPVCRCPKTYFREW